MPGFIELLVQFMAKVFRWASITKRFPKRKPGALPTRNMSIRVSLPGKGPSGVLSTGAYVCLRVPRTSVVAV